MYATVRFDLGHRGKKITTTERADRTSTFYVKFWRPRVRKTSKKHKEEARVDVRIPAASSRREPVR
jgi:hypothetical protein